MAAVADVHFGLDSAGRLRPLLEGIDDRADILVIAGDLTRSGDPAEAAILAHELRRLPVPVVAVLGNHDWHGGRQVEIRAILEQTGIVLLDGEGRDVETAGGLIGVAGCKGFGGGFAGACATDFGEPEMKAFVNRSRREAARLQAALESLRSPTRIAVLHYSPIKATLVGERLEVHAFLGSYLLAEAIDRVGADLAVHGHAHNGTEAGQTPGGVPVRNVAQPLIKRAFNVYEVGVPAAAAVS